MPAFVFTGLIVCLLFFVKSQMSNASTALPELVVVTPIEPDSYEALANPRAEVVRHASPVLAEPEPTPAPAADDWPDFPLGSLGAMLRQYHTRPWQLVASEVGHRDMYADALTAGFVPWEEARERAGVAVRNTRTHVEMVLSARFLGARSPDAWCEDLTERIRDIEQAGGRAPLSLCALHAARDEASALIDLIAVDVRAQIEDLAATESYVRTPLTGFQDMNSPRRDMLLFDGMCTVRGWTMLVEVYKHEVPAVANAVASLEELHGRIASLFPSA